MRRLLVFCLVAVFLASSAVDLCHGWSPREADRAACCEQMANACATWSAGDCCAQGEQRQNRQLVQALVHPARDLTTGPLLAAVEFFGDHPVRRATPGNHPRAHLLHSVFLI